MAALQCVRNVRRWGLWGLWACSLSLAACSNGRGSLNETASAQAGFTIGATVSGLTGTGLVLQNNGTNDLAVSADGPVVFTSALANGAAYNVTVLTQPSNPAQTCTVTNGVGTVSGANVTSVAVSCATSSFAVRVTVTGLAGSGLVLQNNSGNGLPITTDGSYAFPGALASGAAYSVAVLTQPSNPTQTCTVANASGTVGSADVDLAVACATGSFSVGGAVTGLAGSGLVLRNNGADDLSVASNGSFVFATVLASGATYSVTVATQPVGQTCTVANPTGTVTNANVTNVAISCSTNVFTVGGTVSGLAGTGLVLQMNGRNDLGIMSNGSFAFSSALPSGTAYLVSVSVQPSNPSQTCAVANASGTVLDANVTDVAVSCTTNSYSIGGTVTGVNSAGLVLRRNGTEDLSIASNGSFTFATEQLSGSTYEVTIGAQPAGQTCTVDAGSGTVGGGNVRSIRVVCATNTFSISGSVSGLLGDRVVLENNGGDPVEVTANGGFTFGSELAGGAAYNVTVRTQPSNPTQSCTVTNGIGTVGTADISNVFVTCSTSDFMIGGSVNGLAGSGLLLRNNGADDLMVNSNGSFNFTTALPSGATYAVTIAAQPVSPTQVCTVVNGTGVVGGGNVTSVQVDCIATPEFTVGGAVSGLSGAGLLLQNNGGDTLAIASNGSFTFPASLQSGAPYNVTVLAQPFLPSQTCTVTNGAGTIASENVTSVAVSCIDNVFPGEPEGSSD